MYRPPQPRVVNHHQFYPQHFQWNPNLRPRGARHGYQRPDRRMPLQNYNEEHWCETCDRGFPTLNVLEKHKQEHQKCNIDGCQFIAHPKVVTKHIQMQHSTGLFKKIANINNPEDIKRWIEERKTKYPTKLNVEKKAAMIKEKQERGEKMCLNSNKPNRHNQSGDNLKRKHLFGRDDNDKQKKPKPPFTSNINKRKRKIDDKSIPILNEPRKLKPFTGIQDLIMDYEVDENVDQEHCNFDIEDDEDVSRDPLKTENPSNSDPVICGALTSLICNYGSSDEETGVSSTKTYKVAQTTSIKELFLQESNTMSNVGVNIEKDNENDEPEEVKTVKNIDTEIQNTPIQTMKCKESWDKNTKRNKNDNRGKFNRRIKSKLPSTLLQKLLHNEIRHERNTVLQCVRYIVKNDYFDYNKNIS